MSNFVLRLKAQADGREALQQASLWHRSKEQKVERLVKTYASEEQSIHSATARVVCRLLC